MYAYVSKNHRFLNTFKIIVFRWCSCCGLVRNFYCGSLKVRGSNSPIHILHFLLFFLFFIFEFIPYTWGHLLLFLSNPPPPNIPIHHRFPNDSTFFRIYPIFLRPTPSPTSLSTPIVLPYFPDYLPSSLFLLSSMFCGRNRGREGGVCVRYYLRARRAYRIIERNIDKLAYYFRVFR